ncbi:MAG TPA: hypothetical protein VEA99_19465 [Gemmatimonadaceae bacterium]|nr:hypothetical protein [Gemmatimonadaceae bacterium]
MSEGGLPDEVTALIQRALSTMLHVELLLLLHRTAPTIWTAQAAAGELRTTPVLVESVFADLQTARLAAPATGHVPPAWCLDVRDDALLDATVKLREAYDRRPVTLVKALYQRPASPAQAFADAFRLRKDDR